MQSGAIDALCPFPTSERFSISKSQLIYCFFSRTPSKSSVSVRHLYIIGNSQRALVAVSCTTITKSEVNSSIQFSHSHTTNKLHLLSAFGWPFILIENRFLFTDLNCVIFYILFLSEITNNGISAISTRKNVATDGNSEAESMSLSGSRMTSSPLTHILWYATILSILLVIT